LGLDCLRAFLRRHRLVALDTSVFIYQIEANTRYLPFTDYIFRWLEQANGQGVTSTVTMTELLVQPYREFDERRVHVFFALPSTFPNLQWVAPNLEIADRAAQIRATHRLRTPDALQAATAARSGATGLITNDPVFERVEAFETLVLEQILE
jgi:predicted nucleic acid-binding protein